MNNTAPIANNTARNLPSLIEILLADIFNNPGGKTPRNANMNPKKKGRTQDIKYSFFVVSC